MKDFTWWLNTFIGENSGCESNANAFEKCGRSCFQSCNLTEVINDAKQRSKNIDELLAELNKAEIGGGNLKIENGTISGTYEKCYCPYRGGLGSEITPEFCNCTKGWAKSLFELVLGKPTEVELVQAIGRGDKVCKFTAKL